ncbi:MAG: hypothetical protein JWM21_453 [Acidobacteria bacterium]|nr:hypothetical protein [Acidobacteriota bacterium]
MQSKCTSEKWFDHQARSGNRESALNRHDRWETLIRVWQSRYVVDYIMFLGTYSESEVGSIVS